MMTKAISLQRLAMREALYVLKIKIRHVVLKRMMMWTSYSVDKMEQGCEKWQQLEHINICAADAV